ncbi:MAG TPA: hypothetical protein VLZ75_11315 [Chitinophagales bacterium]|nr:hypothetical protein [Chitinophagales bacterium]
MKYTVLILSSFLIFSCQQKENHNTSTQNSESILSSENNEENTEVNQQIGDTIFMNFKNEKGIFEAEGSLDSIHPRVYVKFKNEDTSELKSSIITPTEKVNIRFNQIIFPDNTSDGPFGMDIEIKLTQKGNHILVIGHSLMADHPYQGKFKVHLEY